MDFREDKMSPTLVYKNHLETSELSPVKEYLEGNKFYVEIKVADKTFIYDNDNMTEVCRVRNKLKARLDAFYKGGSRDLILSDIEGLKEV